MHTYIYLYIYICIYTYIDIEDALATETLDQILWREC